MCDRQGMVGVVGGDAPDVGERHHIEAMRAARRAVYLALGVALGGAG